MILFHAGFVRPVLGLLGVRYRRRALVPRGPCLVVANHNSHLDAPVLMSLFPLHRLPHVHPVAAADYFGQTRLRRTMAMILMNAIPIERKAATGTDPLSPVLQALRKGESLVFFPEGSRGEAGVVAPFRPGVGRLVQELPGLLVVPVFMSGAERIWPRGRMVPVPHGIDAAVGKPRTYPPAASTSEIAERVRNDVLAQAPPPPPVPGPRPSPPVRVVVCSIEPELRRAVFLQVVERLGKLAHTVGIGNPIMEADEDGIREVAGGIPIARSRLWVGLLAWALRTGGMSKGSKFAEMVERARVDEALDHGRKSRFVVGDGNALVDLLAWTQAQTDSGILDEREIQQLLQYLTGQRRIPARQWWRFIRNTPGVWLLNVLDPVRPPLPGILVLLRVSPSRLMARIRSRGEELGLHENESFLEKLQEAYVQVARVLKRRWRVEVMEFDAQEAVVDAAASKVEEICRDLASQPDAASPSK